MPHPNDPATRPSSGQHGVSTELRRAGWLSAGALATIAVTVLALALFTSRSLGGTSLHWVATIAVCIEVSLALLGILWLSRQSVAHATTLENQREQLVAQAATLERQSSALATTNARLVDTIAELEEARARSDAEARQKARVVALLDAALSCSPIGFAFFDKDLRFLRVNATLAAISGLPAAEHIGEKLQEVHPWLADEVEPVLRQVVKTRIPAVNVEFEAMRPGARGKPSIWLTSCFPIVTEDDELFGVGLVVTDVTEIKRLEEKFLQAQKMEAVGRLAGGVAHDFNNLLTVISSYAELILFDPAMQKGRDEIQEIRGATQRAAKLTRQLLAFSRRQALEPRIINPNDVIRGVEQLIRGLIVSNIELEMRLSPDTPLIRVDPGQLEQVLMNLAINAADAMSEGGRLTIETTSRVVHESVKLSDPDLPLGLYALIKVSDTGHGMSAETRTQIFEPFFTTKQPGRGTGLGLSTAHGIVKQSGGHIEVESTEGAGSVFSVYLPAVMSSDT